MDWNNFVEIMKKLEGLQIDLENLRKDVSALHIKFDEMTTTEENEELQEEPDQTAKEDTEKTVAGTKINIKRKDR